MKRYIKCEFTDWYQLDEQLSGTLSDTQYMKSAALEEIETFNSYVNDVLSQNALPPVRFKLDQIIIDWANNDEGAGIIAKVYDNNNNMFDYYIDFVIVDNGDLIPASKVYDTTDDYYEQAYDYMNRYYN